MECQCSLYRAFVNCNILLNVFNITFLAAYYSLCTFVADMKPLFRLFLSFVFLLLGGVTNIHTAPVRDNGLLSHHNSFGKFVDAGFITKLNNQDLIVKSIPPSPQKHNKRVYAEESDDENNEIFPFRKKIATSCSDYFFAFYPVADITPLDISKRSRYTEHYSHFSSFKYIVLQVIRV